MSGNILSQAEVENLLRVMDDDSNMASGDGSDVAGFVRLREKVTACDFKRPERVGKEQMRSLKTMHEELGRNFGAALSSLLRTIVEVKLTRVDQLTYSEFVFCLENPTCFNLINASPLEGQLILDVNPSILFPIIDRLLGGTTTSAPPVRRPLTEIELRLVSRITGLFLSEMQHAWENVLKLDLEIDRVESNPQIVQIIPANEVIVLISFEVTMGETRGTMNLCIPFHSIEWNGNKLSANSWGSHGKRSPADESIGQVSNHLSNAPVELVVELAETHITTTDLLGLRVGDIIASEKDVQEPLVVYVEGRPKFHATPGKCKGRKAICVLDGIQERPPATAVSAEDPRDG